MFSTLKLQYKWYIILRLVIVTSILGTGIVTLTRGLDLNFIPLIIIISLTVLMDFIFIIIIKTGKLAKHHLYIQLIFDNLLIFAIIYYTGGRDSVFTMLYFINIITGTFFLFIRGGMLLAVMSTIGYTLLIIGEYFGFILSPYDLNIAGEIILENALMRLYINALGFFFIAAIGGYLSERLAYQQQNYRIRLRDIINNIQSAIIVIDNDYHIDDFNDSAEQLFPGLAVDKPLSSLTSVISENLGREYTQYEKDGRFYDIRMQSIKKGDDVNYILVINDITQMKAYEQKLLEKERLSAIGELSASIAHEIRNPLSSIKGSVSIIGEEVPEQFKEHPMFKIVLEEIERLNNLINDFLTFARVSSINMDTVHLYSMIDNIVKLLGIELLTELNIDRNIYFISDISKLKQVLINILKNAQYAVRNVSEPKIKIAYSNNEKYHIISVEDNGEGISEEIRQRLFQPFNSSKSNGTGLGLAIVFRIIKDELNGDIRYESTQNYTLFEIMIRRIDE